jgi:hypothetical protein
MIASAHIWMDIEIPPSKNALCHIIHFALFLGMNFILLKIL